MRRLPVILAAVSTFAAPNPSVAAAEECGLADES